MRHTILILSRVTAFSILAIMVFGCTITTEGIQNFDVPIEEILPPSRIVASYRQIAKPLVIKDAELEEQFGNKERMEIVDKWSKVKSISSDYGIPERAPKARISVTELSNKQNAYGAYSNLRPSDLNEKSYVKIGVHGTVMEDRLFFVQDRFLIIVRDLASTPEPERRTMLINFGNAISDRLPRDITDISLVGYLPYENRVPASERLDKEDPLGMSILKGGGVTASFKIQDKGEKGDKKVETRECKVFLSDAKDKGSAKTALKQLRKEFDKDGGKTEDLAQGEDGFTCSFNNAPAMIAKRENHRLRLLRHIHRKRNARTALQHRPPRPPLHSAQGQGAFQGRRGRRREKRRKGSSRKSSCA